MYKFILIKLIFFPKNLMCLGLCTIHIYFSKFKTGIDELYKNYSINQIIL